LSQEQPFKGEPLLAALEAADVRYIVIGGFAVTAHGFSRTTKDLDIVPDPDPENLRRLARVLAEVNAEVLGMEEFAEEEIVRPDAEGLEMGGNFVLTTKHGRFDVMQLISPDFEYGDLDGAAIEDEVFGHSVRFCGYEHLVAMKEAAGRDQDLMDLKKLREARENG
jgi:hypothetical protein